MFSATRTRARIFQAAVVLMSAGLVIACSDPTQTLSAPSFTGEAAAMTECTTPSASAFKLASGEPVASDGGSSGVEGDPVVAQQGARTRTGAVARRLTCAGLTTLMAGGPAKAREAAHGAADSAVLVALNTSYVALQPSRAEDFVSSIGVNIHLSYFDRVYGSGYKTIVLPRLQELGLRHLRDGGTSLPNEDWMRTVYDRWVEVAQLTKAQFTVIVSPRRTATGPGTNYGNMSHLLDLRDRIGAANIAAWEGINEHDLFGGSNYVAEVRTLQRALYAQVKADPQMAAQHRVLGPSLARADNASRIGDLSAYMDAGVMHPYDGGQRPSTNLASTVSSMRAINANRSLQATEVGYHTASASNNPWHWSLTEIAQAKYTMRQFLELWNAGVQRSFAYELIDQGTDKTDMEANFGLLRNDGSRKPSFDGLRDLIALLGDRGAPAFTTNSLLVSFSGDTVGVHRLLLEKADGRRYLVLWQDQTSYDKAAKRDITVPVKRVDLGFARAVTKAITYLPLNGSAPKATVRNTRVVSVSVPDHPVVIEVVM